MENFCSDKVRSPDSYGLNSASFRSNERFQELFTELIECASRGGWFKSEYGSVCSFDDALRAPSNAYSCFTWVFSSLRALDRQFLRAEKMSILYDRIARFIDGEIIPSLLMKLYGLESFFRRSSRRWSKFSPYENYTVKCFLDTVLALFEAGHELACEVIVSVVVLSIVYQYLLGYVDRGGTKTYSPGSIEFRDTFVSLLLFRGAYVWIKFRVVNPKGVRRVPKRDKFNKVIKGEYYDKYESRLNPPNERDLHLGTYEKEEHAVLVRRIGLFYYKKDKDKDKGVVTLEDGSLYSIPKMSEEERRCCGEEKRTLVQEKANAVFQEIQEIQKKNKKIREENASRTPPIEDEVEARGCSSPADQSGIALPAPVSADGNDTFLGEWGPGEHEPLESGDGGTFDIFDDFFGQPLSQEIVNEQLADEHQKYRRLEEKCSGLEEKCSGLEEKCSGLEEKYSVLEEKYSGLEEKYSGLKEEFSKPRQEVLEPRQEVLELRQEVSELQQQQNKRLKTGYASSETTWGPLRNLHC